MHRRRCRCDAKSIDQDNTVEHKKGCRITHLDLQGIASQHTVMQEYPAARRPAAIAYKMQAIRAFLEYSSYYLDG